MIILNFDIATGIAKLAAATTIVQGADVPVLVVFSAAPGVAGGIEVALGSDANPSSTLAYTDTFTAESDFTWRADLDASDMRLATFMDAKPPTAVNVELVCLLNGKRQIAPHVQITVQPPIISGATTSEGGPTYLTDTETAAAIAAAVAGLALKTVASKYRIKGDGTFELWNADQNKWHALTISGAAGAEQLSIGAGES